MDATSTKLQLPHAALSDRELEVFRLLVAGMGVNEIAAKLCISHKTVSTHKTRLMEKMNLNSIADLVRYAVQYGLADRFEIAINPKTKSSLPPCRGKVRMG